MSIQEYPDELNYVNAKISERRDMTTSFVHAFAQACLRADDENYTKIRPALHFFMQKYPAEPKRLAAEVADAPPKAPHAKSGFLGRTK
jgi:hypothetical protein